MRFSYTISSLEGLLDVCRTNAPINEAEGNTEQAEHERKVQACVEDAINALKHMAQPSAADFRTRLQLELGARTEEHRLLEAFITTGVFAKLDPEMKELLRKQFTTMTELKSILAKRLALLPPL